MPRCYLKQCPHCLSLISSNNLPRHVTACNGEGTWHQKEKRNSPNNYPDGYPCSVCGTGFTTAQGRAGHEYRSHSPLWKEKAKALGVSQRGNLRACLSHTDATKRKMSEIAKKRQLGGQFCGRHFWYKSISGDRIHMHSSFEIKVAESLDGNGVSWTRPEALSWVDKERETHRYYPDFFLPQFDVYLDPKNDYLIATDIEKIKRASVQNECIVLILNKDQLEWSEIHKMINSRSCSSIG